MTGMEALHFQDPEGRDLRVMSPQQYQRLPASVRRRIIAMRPLPPQLGEDNFGYLLVELRGNFVTFGNMEYTAVSPTLRHGRRAK